MFSKRIFFSVLFVAFSLLGCKSKPFELPLAGAPVGKPDQTARIQEGSMLLRGLNEERLSSVELPNPYSNYIYVVNPGRHTLLGINIQTGHFLMPTDLRCYSLEVTLLPGVEYILNEDKNNDQAVIKRTDTGEVVATGEKFEQRRAYTGVCDWGQKDSDAPEKAKDS